MPYVGWDKRQRRPTICPMWWACAPLVPPYEFTNGPAVAFSMRQPEGERRAGEETLRYHKDENAPCPLWCNPQSFGTMQKGQGVQ